MMSSWKIPNDDIHLQWRSSGGNCVVVRRLILVVYRVFHWRKGEFDSGNSITIAYSGQAGMDTGLQSIHCGYAPASSMQTEAQLYIKAQPGIHQLV